MLGRSIEDSESSFKVLDVRFHRYGREQVIEKILHWVGEKSRRLVITAGPEFVMKAQADAEVAHIALVADVVTADGIGIIWAAKKQNIQLPGRVSGVDFVISLLETAEQRRQALRVFLLGANEDTLNSCLKRFRDTYPSCTFAGYHGYFEKHEEANLIATVRAFEPDLWLVGLGQPKQEKFIFQHLGTLPPCVGIGIGGSIDVWGGMVKRAPKIFQRMNVEWLWRLLRQPSRLRRQMVLPHFAWKVLRSPGGGE